MPNSSDRSGLEELHTVIRRATGRGQVRNPFKATIVGSLGLRQFNVEGRQRQAANNTLVEALWLDDVWEKEWANTEREPVGLRDAALCELDDTGEPGPSCRELLVKAAAHLAANGWLTVAFEGSCGEERDQRQPSVVLNVMHRTRQGISVLAEALAAGRRCVDARALDESGNVIERAAGDALPLTHAWIRRIFKDAPTPDPSSKTTHATTPQSPRERVAAYMRIVERHAHELEQAIRDAERVDDSEGQIYLDRHGWSRGETTPMVERLRSAAEQLEKFGLRAEVIQSLPPLGRAEQLGLDAMFEEVS